MMPLHFAAACLNRGSASNRSNPSCNLSGEARSTRTLIPAPAASRSDADKCMSMLLGMASMGVPAVSAGYTPPVPPWETTTAERLAVSSYGSRSARETFEAISPTARPDVDRITLTGNRDSASRTAGSALMGPELPRLTKTFGCDEAITSFHQGGFVTCMGQAHVPMK